ncbi:FAR1 DNA binding domain, FHY3/FAR1 family [Artemisia annua]|uniref:FAR1 DNA binding domain, FHY3/FAR1 family n=1 Tax=Artemisia annua TaxID=35608 RepID=A0A2U1QL23_ARTAN|nr:FAR1 DNA binding domain, FHY3/FAR1 family [Artemisia annua]
MSQVSDAFVKKPFRKNTSCKTNCSASMRVRKIEGDVHEVNWFFVAEHNHPLVSPQDMQFLMNSRALGFSKQRFLMEGSNGNVGPVRAFKLMKEMYGGDRDVQMAVENLENLEKPFKLMKEMYGRADNAAKLNYKRFGDVMSFDATFRTNK